MVQPDRSHLECSMLGGCRRRSRRIVRACVLWQHYGVDDARTRTVVRVAPRSVLTRPVVVAHDVRIPCRFRGLPPERRQSLLPRGRSRLAVEFLHSAPRKKTPPTKVGLLGPKRSPAATLGGRALLWQDLPA